MKASSRLLTGACLLPVLLLPCAAQLDTLHDMIRAELNAERYTLQDLQLPDVLGVPFVTEISLDGTTYVASLEPYSVRTVDFVLLVQGEDGEHRSVEAPPSATFRGHLLGREGAVVAVSLLDGQIKGTISFDDGTLWGIEPLNMLVPEVVEGGTHVVYDAGDVLPYPYTCGVPDQPAPSTITPSGDATGLDLCEIAFDCDTEFYQANGSSVSNTVNNTENLMNSIDVIYARDCTITYEISTIHVWTGTDPYTSTDPGTRLNQFGTAWNGTFVHVKRDVAHLLTGANLSGSVIGVAWLNVICNLSSAYGLSQTTCCSFTYRVGLTAHEVGHNWNAIHCDGDSDCWIMCSGLGGCAGNVSKFGSRSKTAIKNKANGSGCLLDLADPIVPPFTETWPTTSFNSDVWIHRKGTSISSSASAEPSSPYALELDSWDGDPWDDNEIRSNFILMGGLSDVVFSYYTQHRGVESGESLVVEYAKSNGDWVAINTVVSNGTTQGSFDYHSHVLPAEAYHDEFRIRFRTVGNDSGDDWYIDDISVGGGTPPGWPPTVYCTGKLNSEGCVSEIGYSGNQPLLSLPIAYYVEGFNLVRSKPGLVFYGSGRNNLPFQGGFLCVAPPIKRTPPQLTTGGLFPCDGTLSFDLGTYLYQNPGSFQGGETLNAGIWTRDPGDPAGYGTALTPGIECEILP